MWACKSNYPEVVKALLNARAGLLNKAESLVCIRTMHGLRAFKKGGGLIYRAVVYRIQRFRIRRI